MPREHQTLESKANLPTSLARRVRVLLHFSYLISHISYSHSHNLLLSYLVSYTWGGEFEGMAGFRPHDQIGLNPALSSYAILTYFTYLLTLLTCFTYGVYTICSFAHTNAYLELFGAIWKYLELSGSIWSSLELSGSIWSSLELSVAVWSLLKLLYYTYGIQL